MSEPREPLRGEDVEVALLRWYLAHKLSFRAVAAMAKLLARFNPPVGPLSPQRMRTTLLDREWRFVKEQQAEELRSADRITVAIDAWTKKGQGRDDAPRRVYAWVATLSDGRSRVLAVRDLTDAAPGGAAAIAGARARGTGGGGQNLRMGGE
jgi:hypothetical protein